jgi:hypothetical protein
MAEQCSLFPNLIVLEWFKQRHCLRGPDPDTLPDDALFFIFGIRIGMSVHFFITASTAREYLNSYCEL